MEAARGAWGRAASMRYPLQQGFRYFLSSVTGAGVCRVFERAARVLFARRRGATALAAGT